MRRPDHPIRPTGDGPVPVPGPVYDDRADIRTGRPPARPRTKASTAPRRGREACPEDVSAAQATTPLERYRRDLVATTTTALRCVVCATPIHGAYRAHRFWKLPYHRHHGACGVCGHPTAEVGAGSRCTSCRRSAVDDPTVARARLHGVQVTLERRGMNVRRHPIGFELVDFTGSGRESTLGMTSTTRVPSAGGNHKRISVSIRCGLPDVLFDAVAAHELTHVWFRINDVAPALVLEEGVAELTSYWLLSQIRDRRAAALRYRTALEPDPIYGNGFRMARSAELHHGWPVVATSLLRRGTLP